MGRKKYLRPKIDKRDVEALKRLESADAGYRVGVYLGDLGMVNAKKNAKVMDDFMDGCEQENT